MTKHCLKINKTMAMAPLIYWCENWAVVRGRGPEAGETKCLRSAAGCALCGNNTLRKKLDNEMYTV
jgi:hypothetical protein